MMPNRNLVLPEAHRTLRKLVSDVLRHLREITAERHWGYHPNGPQSAEPAALASLAFCAHEHPADATPLADWLADIQAADGSVGVTREQPTPAWPTSLALLAWQALGDHRFDAAVERSLAWSLQTKGKAAPQQPHIGHDTTLTGWSWAAATHSWLEPTCYFVLALKALGQRNHPRTREGVQLIIDRLLDAGGCNFGNTRVLGQATLPHVQPSGLAMWAIADEPSTDPRIGASLAYLEHAANKSTATASLSFALLGLTAHGKRPSHAETLIQHAFARELETGPSCYKLALLSLASLETTKWTHA